MGERKVGGALYSVTAVQSLASRLPVYVADGGWLFGSVGLLWAVSLTPQWMVAGSMESRRLQGDAARSPWVERSSSQYLSAGLAYRF